MQIPVGLKGTLGELRGEGKPAYSELASFIEELVDAVPVGSHADTWTRFDRILDSADDRFASAPT